MIVNSVKLNNFQPYYNEHTIELSEGVNLILGVSGKGKSTLFNAFYWVLFGRLHFTENGWCSRSNRGWMLVNDPIAGRVAPSIDIINKRALFEQSDNNPVIVSVEMNLSDDKGYQYTVSREIKAVRIDTNGAWDDDTNWQLSDDILSVSFETNMGTLFKDGIEAEEVIRGLFSPSIRNYIWFQGESLEKLIDFKDPNTLADAVKYISYYPAYEDMLNVVNGAIRLISKDEQKKLAERNAQNRDLKILLSQISETEAKLEDAKNKRQTKIDERERIQQKLTENEAKYHALASFSGLVTEYNQWQNKFNSVKDKISEFNDYQIKQTPIWCLRGIEDLVNEARDIINSYTAIEYTAPEKKYLDNPSRAKLQEILKDKKCFVCGTEFTEHDAAYHYIEERLRLQDEYLKEMEEYTNNLELSKQFNMFIGKIQDYPTNVTRTIGLIDDRYAKSEDAIDKLLAERSRCNAKMQELNNKIEEVKKQYGVDPVRQATSADVVASNMQVNRNSIAKLDDEIRSLDKAIEKYSSELQSKKTKMEFDKSSGSIQGVEESKWRILSEVLQPICKRVQENARYDLLSKIRTTSNQLYEKFTCHDIGYKGLIEISDDYSIKHDPVLNTGHNDRKKMSILNAMLYLNQQAQGVYYPFITDAPTSNLDMESTYKYLLGIQDVFKQSIIMTSYIRVGSEEYSNLLQQSKVSKVYKIEQRDGGDNPERHEVYSVIEQIK